MNNFLVFSGTATRYLTEKICTSLGIEMGNINVTSTTDAPTNVNGPGIYTSGAIEDNDVNGFICKSALPLFLMVFGIFYFFKPIFRLIGLAKKKDI